MLAPEVAAQNQFESARATTGKLIVARKCAAHHRLDSEDVKKFRTRLHAPQAGRALFPSEGKGAITINRDARQGLILLTKVKKIRIRKRTERCLIFMASVGHPKGNQLLRIG